MPFEKQIQIQTKIKRCALFIYCSKLNTSSTKSKQCVLANYSKLQFIICGSFFFSFLLLLFEQLVPTFYCCYCCFFLKKRDNFWIVIKMFIVQNPSIHFSIRIHSNRFEIIAYCCIDSWWRCCHQLLNERINVYVFHTCVYSLLAHIKTFCSSLCFSVRFFLHILTHSTHTLPCAMYLFFFLRERSTPFKILPWTYCFDHI